MECVREGKALIDDNYWSMVGICFLGTVMSGMAPLYILYGPMICGISYCMLALVRREPVELADLFKGFNFFGPAFLTGLVEMLPILILGLPLYLLWIVISVVLAGTDSEELSGVVVLLFGLCWIFIVLASVVAHLLCTFSFPLVVEWKLNGWDAVKLSAQAIRANLGGAIGLFLLTGLILFAGALLCGVGVYLAIPISYAAWTVAYTRVFEAYPRHLDVPPDPPKWQDWRPEGGA